MSDDELLALIAQTPSDQWSEKQMEIVRERLPTSAALRKAMTNRLKLEGYLAGSIGGNNVSAQQIVAAASKIRPLSPPKKTSPRRLPWTIALGVVALLSVVTWKWWPDAVSLVAGGPDPKVPVDNQPSGTDSIKARTTGKSSDNAGETKPTIGPEIKPATIPGPRAPEPDASFVAVAPPAEVERQPWEHERHLGGAPVSYRTAAFVDVGLGDYAPRRDDLRKWLAGLPGERLDIQERNTDTQQMVGAFEGRARLRAPWPADAMLRLAVRDANKLKLYFWCGDRGAMFQYHEDRRYAWAAYVVTREKGEFKPKTLALTATDDERGYRTNREGRLPFDVFYRDGVVTLARGGISVISAPLDGLPTEVEFAGRATFNGLAMSRVVDFPPTRGLSDIAFVQRRPGDRPWETKLAESGNLDRTSDGAIELVSEKTKEPSIALTPATPGDVPSLEYRTMFARRRDPLPLPTNIRGRIFELIVRVDNPSSGTSVFLADGKGQTTDVARFMREKASSGRGVWLVGAGDGRSEIQEDLNGGPVPLVADSVWLRMLSAGGVVRISLSSDGTHWARPWDIRSTSIMPRMLGVSLPSSDTPKKIRVSQIMWRELAGLSMLASETARAKAVAPETPRDFGRWKSLALESAPEGIEANDWLRAVALRSLAENASGDLAADLVRFLAEQMPALELKRSMRILALDDLALVANTQDNPRRAESLMSAYVEATRRSDEQPPRSYSDAIRAITTSPIATRGSVLPKVESLAREELLRLVDAEAWSDVDQLCRELRFRDDLPAKGQNGASQQESSMIAWAMALARRHIPTAAGEPRLPVNPSWRGALVEQSNTEVFNVLAEFQAAIEGKAFTDAADIISSAGEKLADSSDRTSVLRDAADENLFVSLPVAVGQAMRANSALASAMQERYGAAAQLRVRQAIVDGNVKSLEAATLQYHGTTAAAEAHLWLGKRALSAGEFAKALGNFRGAMESSDQTVAAEAKSRARLAGALVGRVMGEATTSLVQFGDSQIAAADFERVIGELSSRSKQSTTQGDNVSPDGVAPARFTSVRRGEFRLGPVSSPRVRNDDARFEVDWFARNTTVATSTNQLIVAGRSSAAAFDTGRGTPLWEASLRNAPVAETKDWPTSRAEPMIIGDRVLVRWFAKSGPMLVCLRSTDGSMLWQTDNAQQVIVGDPFLAQDELFVLVAKQDALEQNWQLSLAALDIETGEVLRSRPLVRLADSWRQLAVCQRTLDGGRLFVSLGGVVLCGDLSGQVHWVRTMPHVPVTVDSWSYAQTHDAPRILGDRLFVASPGVRKIVCLDAESGRLHWGFGDPNFMQLVTLAGEHAIVRTADGLVALDVANGQPHWHYALDDHAEVLLDSGSNGLVLLQRQSNEKPALVWLDSVHGQVRDQWIDESWEERDGQYGPLAVSAQGRMWMLRTGKRSPEVREVIELAPPGVTLEATPVAEPTETQKDPAAIIAEIQTAINAIAPNWKVTSGATSPAGTLVKHVEADKVFLAIAAKGTDVACKQDVTLPAASKGRLRIKAGFVANEAWNIRVTAGSQTLLDKQIGGGSQPGWERFELDLATIAGQPQTIEVTASTPDEKPRKILLHRLLVVP